MRPFRSIRWLAALVIGGLGTAAGCEVVPPGAIPDSNTPNITINPSRPARTTPGQPAGTQPGAPVQPPGVTTPPGQPGNWTVPGTTPQPNPAPSSPPSVSPPSSTPAPAGSDLASLETYVYQQTNAERAKTGAAALTSDPTLNTLARSRSQDMVTRNYFDHVTPDGKRVFDMLTALNFPYTTAGENIAYNTYPGSQSAQQVMQQWMNSSGHRANILNTSYGKIGVGAWKRDSDGATFYTQVFTN